MQHETVPNALGFLDFLRRKGALTVEGPTEEKKESYWGHGSLHRTWAVVLDGRKLGTYTEVHKPDGKLAIQRYDGRVPGYRFLVRAGRSKTEVRESLNLNFHTDVYNGKYRGRMDRHRPIPFP